MKTAISPAKGVSRLKQIQQRCSLFGFDPEALTTSEAATVTEKCAHTIYARKRNGLLEGTEVDARGTCTYTVRELVEANL